MKLFFHRAGIFAFAAAAAATAAPISASGTSAGTFSPALGYIAPVGRGNALMLANADGSSGQTAYRYASGAHYDLTSAAQHLAAVEDNHRIYIFGWSVNGSTLVTSASQSVYGGPVRAYTPSFSQDGTKLAFYTDDYNGTGQIHVVDSSTRQQLAIFPSKFAERMNWMPDGNSIVIADTDLATGTMELTEYPSAGGAGSILLQEPNIDDFDTSRVPGDRKMLVSFSRPDGQSIHIAVYDPDARTYAYMRTYGSAVKWNCPMTKFAYHGVSNGGANLYAYDYGSGTSSALVNKGAFPHYVKCDASTLTLNALRMQGRRH